MSDMAIKYAMMKKKKKMAEGGAVEEDDRMLNQHGEDEEGPMGGGVESHEESEMGDPEHDQDHQSSEDLEDDLVSRVIKQHMFSKGGRIANDGEANLGRMADSHVNNFDDLSLRDDLESSYTGENSGDHLGNKELDEDGHDIVARVMRELAKKDRLPSPR